MRLPRDGAVSSEVGGDHWRSSVPGAVWRRGWLDMMAEGGWVEEAMSRRAAVRLDL